MICAPKLINAEWTPQQAAAVFELLDDLRECIWNRYAPEIREIVRDQRAPDADQDEANSLDPIS